MAIKGESEVTVKLTQSCPTLCDPMGLYSLWDSPGQNTGVGSLSLLQGIFPTQESNPGLPHCRRILNQLSHKESPKVLKWVAYPFSSGSPWPRNQTRVSCIAGDSLPTELSVNLHSCDHRHNSILEHFHHPRRYLVPIYSHFLFPFPAPGTH